MLIPQAKPKRPVAIGVSSTTVVALAGRERASAKSAKMTLAVQSPDS